MQPNTRSSTLALFALALQRKLSVSLTSGRSLFSFLSLSLSCAASRAVSHFTLHKLLVPRGSSKFSSLLNLQVSTCNFIHFGKLLSFFFSQPLLFSFLPEMAGASPPVVVSFVSLPCFAACLSLYRFTLLSLHLPPVDV